MHGRPSWLRDWFLSHKDNGGPLERAHSIPLVIVRKPTTVIDVPQSGMGRASSSTIQNCRVTCNGLKHLAYGFLGALPIKRTRRPTQREQRQHKLNCKDGG